MHWLIRVVAIAALCAALPAQALQEARGGSETLRATRTSFAEARGVLEALPANLPGALAGRQLWDIQAGWDEWTARRDAEIRGRLERGDEDTLVNLWLFGRNFTALPPARDPSPEGRTPAASLDTLRRGRLDDLMAALASPGDSERMQYARVFLEGRGLDPTTSRGQREIRTWLEATRLRAVEEFAGYDASLESARAQDDPDVEIATYATIFSARGLSTDTSILPDFAVEQTLRSLRSSGILARGSIRRVAVVGPGLDVINKARGFDVYPPQTHQPLALADSLVRLELAREDDLHVTTFDLSPRVNRHLAGAVQAAAEGHGYLLRLPLDTAEPWEPELLAFWARLGDRVGQEAPAERLDADTDVRLRAVRVRPDVVASMRPLDVNIVVERLALPPDERFDLVVGTNVFVYYEAFEQALALANVASMLRPGGVVLSNTLMLPTPPMKTSAAHAVIRYSARQHDHMFWYQRDE